MEGLLGGIVSFLIGLLTNRTSEALASERQKEFQALLTQEDKLRASIAAVRSIPQELNHACVTLAKEMRQRGVSAREEALLNMLTDQIFQNDFYKWLVAGAITEGEGVQKRLLDAMARALQTSGATPQQVDDLREKLFATLEKTLFANNVLAHWRHQLSLDYLRQQVTELRLRAEEAAGVYSPEKRQQALEHYLEKALAAWDIIDLTNLPAEDAHLATQKLLLRQLFMPLRINVEGKLEQMEKERELRRLRDAGHGPQAEIEKNEQSSLPVGECLGASRRLVVLGDPGGGKTTLLRWMATAYLLHYKKEEGFNNLPDVHTLPEQPWIPVLIRCRDLGEADLSRDFVQFLTQHLYKTELQPQDAVVMQSIILDGIAKGEVLLLVDGLDEISQPRVRAQFCQELERTSARYPQAPILITSRIVGYRDMPYRMGGGFVHGVIAELNRDDRNNFVQRWVQVTEQHLPKAQQEQHIQELNEAMHGNDRIERLVGNPMLLTTLALVKRKVGKLPNRRSELYSETVGVLLNWNPLHYQQIDKREALPQLKYLAYEMCRRGVQRLPQDEVLTLLDGVRQEYPNLRAVRNRTPEEFLTLLEGRSSLLIQSGVLPGHNSRQEQVTWEFRHLTFQEYLAARGLLDGCYPGRNRGIPLADQVAILAGQVQTVEGFIKNELMVPDSWREALRLLVSDCRDDDVDEILLAILRPLKGEDSQRTSKARAVLATLCLADEPNVSEAVGLQVLQSFVAHLEEADGSGFVITLGAKAAMEVAKSLWLPNLRHILLEEYCKQSDQERGKFGGLWRTIATNFQKSTDGSISYWETNIIQRLQSWERVERIAAALEISNAAFLHILPRGMEKEIVSNLLNLLANTENYPEIHALCWALGWLRNDPYSDRTPYWIPEGDEIDRLMHALNGLPDFEINSRQWLYLILASSNDARVVPVLVTGLGEIQEPWVQCTMIEALGKFGDAGIADVLIPFLEEEKEEVDIAAAAALLRLGDDRVLPVLHKLLDDSAIEKRQKGVTILVQARQDDLEKRLLSHYADGFFPWLDPHEPITESRVLKVAKEVNLTPQEVRSRYEAIAEIYHLTFA